MKKLIIHFRGTNGESASMTISDLPDTVDETKAKAFATGLQTYTSGAIESLNLVDTTEKGVFLNLPANNALYSDVNAKGKLLTVIVEADGSIKGKRSLSIPAPTATVGSEAAFDALGNATMEWRGSVKTMLATLTGETLHDLGGYLVVPKPQQRIPKVDDTGV